jgi:hypothetical protein
VKRVWHIAVWHVVSAEKMKHAPDAETQVAKIKNGAIILTVVKRKV